MNIYTIGFAQKSAEEFFKLLTSNGVKKLIDIRLNNKSQLAGFANAKHLPYFLKLHNIEYEYKPELAPSKELLDGYKKKEIDWKEYEKIYNKILVDRDILNTFSKDEIDSSVLLCSEPAAEQCHRRLASEHLADNLSDLTIKHL